MTLQQRAYHSPLDRARQLKAQIDLRDFYQSETGRGRRSGKAVYDKTPWREDEHHSLVIFADGWKDMATGEVGDVVDMVRRLYNMTFSEAVEYIEARYGGHISALPSKPRIAQQYKDSSKPPAPDWQAKNRTVVEAAERCLWSAEGLPGLDYLHERGYTDETIQRKHYGYATDQTMRRLFGMPEPAIVIPWQDGSNLWAVKFRRFSGDPKYIQVGGGNQAGALYGSESIRPGLPIVFVEGEFDQALLDQASGDLANFVTLGSVQNKLGLHWRAVVESAPLVVLARDNDDPGLKAAQDNAAGLPASRQVVTVPQGKDPGEYATKHGGDLRAWISDAVRNYPVAQDVTPAQVQRWPETVTDSLERAILRYWGKAGRSVAAAARGIVEYTNIVGRSDFDLIEVAKHSGIEYRKLYRAVESYGLSECFEPAEQTAVADDNSRMTSIDLIPTNTGREESVPAHPHSGIIQSPGGKTARRYKLTGYSQFCDLFLKRIVAQRLVEAHYMPERGEVGKATAALLHSLEVSPDETESAINARLDADLPEHYQTARQRAHDRARLEYKRTARSLQDKTCTPMPDAQDWRKDYAVAVTARAVLPVLGTQVSWSEITRSTGLPQSTLARSYVKLGIVNESRYHETGQIVKSVDALPDSRYSEAFAGYPERVVTEDGQTLDYRSEAGRQAAIRRLASGQQIRVDYRQASVPRMMTEAERVAAADQPRAQDKQKPVVEGAKSTAMTEPKQTYTGPGHDPRYARRWAIGALVALGYQSLEFGVSDSNGEMVADRPLDQLTGPELVMLLKGESLVDIPDDPLLLDIIALGGRVIDVEATNQHAA